MLNKIITAISQALDDAFNVNSDDYAIYTENVEQGLNEPCFFIFSLEPSNKQLIRNRYERTYPFDIHYFPKSEDRNNEINEITETLFDVLEYVNLDDGPIKGTNMHGEIIDNVLHFFINFNMIVAKDIQKEDSMENLKVEGNLKG
ncbi:hypothetical protein FDF11_08275 [Clostridium botulinum]|nr:hypothetical protein [Clostridium botulinum]NFR13703.1 hypothetical protein [Clostridium botulinum]NFR42230.1 hypothetical protein [Clostridium botulinum]NFS50670.1 hypothetical protein [Clostridium botulinum]